MPAPKDTKQNDPRIFQTIRRDIKQSDLFRNFKKETGGLKEYYLDENKKKELEGMSKIGKWIKQIWWIFNSAFLQLTPLRRLLVFVGMILIVISNSVRFNGENVQSDNSALLGGILLLFVLILELKDKLLAKSELEEGRAVQQLLMPPESPAVDGWQLWLYTYPANEVSGDLVDFIKIDESRNAVIIADVAGKGLKAALLMAKLQATIRAVANDFSSLEKLAAKINTIFHRDSPASLFASFLYCEIKSESRIISFVNAGHFPPIIIKTDGVIEMEKGTAALGLMREVKYNEQKIELKNGEIFLAYSDGLIEAQNENSQFFGKERLVKILSSINNLDPQSIGKLIISEVNRFVGDAVKFDDLSLIIMKKN